MAHAFRRLACIDYAALERQMEAPRDMALAWGASQHGRDQVRTLLVGATHVAHKDRVVIPKHEDAYVTLRPL